MVADCSSEITFFSISSSDKSSPRMTTVKQTVIYQLITFTHSLRNLLEMVLHRSDVFLKIARWLKKSAHNIDGSALKIEDIELQNRFYIEKLNSMFIRTE